ncbi:MAG: hypothetical protein COU08_04130 [Candidatus Harrisonbacteria bacterium CG10_big_fil_rev_8_21_14_0_10_42_17]|uniref:DUF5678 domain-containing protein n=1 Tax=Candidatus Harrisonbacteria bacterium CG10_big_fil_rev_8_21_14_0_10_42_17 TaxID=1974584 RepID=A0A2M6WGV7_9BACT|nr:MAG: hypothetical protein COU08_04130 [Candidatus Harrisonbacteria bacterium CG10_big_fil_rev_8_21_14_0_10_42_17]
MSEINIKKINLEKLDRELERLQEKWVAISEENKIVASGKTYNEALKNIKPEMKEKTIFLKIPPLNYSISP